MKETDVYLGAKVLKWAIDGLDDPTKTRWTMLSNLYVKCAVSKVNRI